jgi:hypothetical protein
MTWLVARWLAGVYSDRAFETWAGTAEHRQRFLGSWQGRIVMAGSTRAFAASMAAAAALAAPDARQRRALEDEARRLARSATKVPASSFPTAPTGALLACLDGDRDRAVAVLRRSVRVPRGRLFTHLLRRRLGELLGGDEGAALIVEADAFLLAGGVIDPARFTAAWMPGLAIATER